MDLLDDLEKNNNEYLSLYYTEFEQDRVYHFRFLDIFNTDVVDPHHNDRQYLVFRAKCLKDYQDQGLRKDMEICVHISKKTYMKAFAKLYTALKANGFNADRSKVYEANISLRRKNKMVLEFLQFEIQDGSNIWKI